MLPTTMGFIPLLILNKTNDATIEVVGVDICCTRSNPYTSVLLDGVSLELQSEVKQAMTDYH